MSLLCPLRCVTRHRNDGSSRWGGLVVRRVKTDNNGRRLPSEQVSIAYKGGKISENVHIPNVLQLFAALFYSLLEQSFCREVDQVMASRLDWSRNRIRNTKTNTIPNHLIDFNANRINKPQSRLVFWANKSMANEQIFGFPVQGRGEGNIGRGMRLSAWLAHSVNLISFALDLPTPGRAVAQELLVPRAGSESEFIAKRKKIHTFHHFYRFSGFQGSKCTQTQAPPTPRYSSATSDNIVALCYLAQKRKFRFPASNSLFAFWPAARSLTTAAAICGERRLNWRERAPAEVTPERANTLQ